MLSILVGLVALLMIAALGVGGYLAVSMRWLMKNSIWDRYFKLPLKERRAFHKEVARRAERVLPLIRLVSRIKKINIPITRFEGICAPMIACPKKVFVAATKYRPDERDIFVATQMKCGTTWLQQIVYETLLHGNGDLGDDGHRHMYALSPWIEASAAVAIDDAPRIGVGEQRIVKTHFPVKLCPYSDGARFLYLVRSPVSCFASCVDFVQMLGGPMAPDRADLLDWFCSERMWWGPWADHAAGWWDWAQERPNVLFLHYEAMLDDLGAAVDRVAAFLDVSLAPDERANVVGKSGYDYMKAHEHVFEMAAPNFFSVQGGNFFVSGKSGRDRDAAAHERQRILEFTRGRLKGANFPAARFYPELA